MWIETRLGQLVQTDTLASVEVVAENWPDGERCDVIGHVAGGEGRCVYFAGNVTRDEAESVMAELREVLGVEVTLLGSDAHQHKMYYPPAPFGHGFVVSGQHDPEPPFGSQGTGFDAYA